MEEEEKESIDAWENVFNPMKAEQVEEDLKRLGKVKDE